MYRISSIKPPGDLSHQRGGLLDWGGLIGGGVYLIFQAKVRKVIIAHYYKSLSLIWKIGLGRATHGLYWAGFESNWRPSWKDHPQLGYCKQIILRGFRNGLEYSQHVPLDNFKRKYY